jgi:hypothetical protein
MMDWFKKSDSDKSQAAEKVAEISDTKLESAVNKVLQIRKIYILFALIAVVLLFAGICIKHPPHGFTGKEAVHLFGFFATEFAIAIIVALIIICTIEANQRQEQIHFFNSLTQRISKSLFSAVYKKHIPDPVIDGILKDLINCQVMRTEHTINYSITEPEEELLKNDFVICNITSRYRLQNVTDRTISQDIVLFVESPLKNEHAKYCVIDHIKVDGLPKGSPAGDDSKLVDSNYSVKSKCTVEIMSKDYVQVETQSRTIKLKNDMEVWSLVHISDGIKINVNADRSLGLTIDASAKHSKKLTPTRSEVHNKSWELNAGTYPHQSVLIWWKAPQKPITEPILQDMVENNEG